MVSPQSPPRLVGVGTLQSFLTSNDGSLTGIVPSWLARHSIASRPRQVLLLWTQDFGVGLPWVLAHPGNVHKQNYLDLRNEVSFSSP